MFTDLSDSDRLGNERNRKLCEWERDGRLVILPTLGDWDMDGKKRKYKRYSVRVLVSNGETRWVDFTERVCGPFVSEELFAKVALLALLTVPIPDLK